MSIILMDSQYKNLEWKDVVGFEGLYKVSSNGDILSLYKNKILKTCWVGEINKRYHGVHLFKDKVAHTKAVHRIVADAFIEPKKGTVVDHINNIKTDNRSVNLQRISMRLNNSKDRKVGKGGSKFPGVRMTYNGKWRSAIKVNKISISLGTYSTEKEAADAYYNHLKSLNESAD